jgi:hypothetical protein
MKKQFLSFSLGSALVVVALAATQARGAIFELDFNTEPDSLAYAGTAEWRPDGGVDDSGYLAITDAANGQSGAILLPNLEEGNALVAYDITADLRVGGGTDRPADGFSFNLARLDDPAIENVAKGQSTGWAASPTGENNLPEEGTTTGLAIGFDEWFSGGADVVGMSIRIDNELVDQYEFPVLNGDVDDQESLQTGPEATDASELGWARLELYLSADNNLQVYYKDVEVFNQQIDYEKEEGLLVFSGRTGGANSNHHIDNITIRTNADAKGRGGGGGVTGDFNNDGVLNLPDINDLTGQSASGTNNKTYDLNADNLVNVDDVNVWVGQLYKTWVGDADLNFEFNSSDLVNVLAAGKYEANLDSVWSEGDFDGTGRTNSSDLVAALAGGGYEQGPFQGGAAAVVPEPSGLLLVLAGLLSLVAARRSR